MMDMQSKPLRLAAWTWAALLLLTGTIARQGCATAMHGGSTHRHVLQTGVHTSRSPAPPRPSLASTGASGTAGVASELRRPPPVPKQAPSPYPPSTQQPLPAPSARASPPPFHAPSPAPLLKPSPAPFSSNVPRPVAPVSPRPVPVRYRPPPPRSPPHPHPYTSARSPRPSPSTRRPPPVQPPPIRPPPLAPTLKHPPPPKPTPSQPSPSPHPNPHPLNSPSPHPFNSPSSAFNSPNPRPPTSPSPSKQSPSPLSSPSSYAPPEGGSGHQLARGLSVWVVAGQSNAMGINGQDRSPMPGGNCSQTDPDRIIQWLAGSKTWAAAAPNVATRAYRGTNRAFSNGGLGPEISFAHALLAAGAAERVGFVHSAVKGSCLCDDAWMPGTPIYQKMLDFVNEAMQSLPPSAQPAQLAGIIWVQGENNAAAGLNDSSAASSYAQRFTQWVHAVRMDLAPWAGRSPLPVVMAVMSVQGRKEFLPLIEIVRAQQLGLKLLRLVKADMQGLEFYPEDKQAAQNVLLHLAKLGACHLGERLAAAYLQEYANV